MKNILCYGDSNTYGLSPDWLTSTSWRHDKNTRWPGALQNILGEDYNIIEEGLNGRTTVFEDPTAPGRCGLDHLQVSLESHMPLDLVILVLGTNDTKPMFGVSAFEIAAGMSRLAKTALNPYTYLHGTPPQVLIAAPVPMGEASLKFAAPGDTEAMDKSKQLAAAYKQTADMLGCHFIDFGQYAKASDTDGVHLTAEAHLSIASAVAEKVKTILG